MHLQAESLCFEGDRAATAEWVDDRGWPGWIAAPDFSPCFFKDLLVSRRFPRNQPLDDVK